MIPKLQRLQNCAARLVVRPSSSVHVTPILKQLHWLTVKTRISYKIACLCFNAISYSTPSSLSDLLHLYSPSISFRFSADTCLLKLPLYKSINARRKVIVPSLILALPSGPHCHFTSEMLQLSILFKSALKTHLFNLQDFDLLSFIWCVSVCVRECVCACMHMCMRVCVCVLPL